MIELNLLKEEFVKYIPHERENLSEITPRIMYIDVLNSLENYINKLEEYKQMYLDLCK